MSEKERGVVMPFGLPGGQLRRRAAEYRRRGQPLEALSLLRRAAEQDDTYRAWQMLAEELIRLGCWETAEVLLARAHARAGEAEPPFLAMAQCLMKTGHTTLADDCLRYILKSGAWSPEVEKATELLEEMEDPLRNEQGRSGALTGRAMNAWQEGRRELALQRMQRVVRITRGKLAHPMNILGFMYASLGQERPALCWLTRAIRCEPDNGVALCSLAAMLAESGRERKARLVLRKAAPLCQDASLEDRFTLVAWHMQAWPELRAYLDARLKKYPYRIPLLHTRADLLYEKGKLAQARDIWRLILSVDPEDRAAVTLLRWTEKYPDRRMPAGSWPPEITREQRSLLKQAAELFRCGSEGRRVLNWCAASENRAEEELAFVIAQLHPDREGEILWLKEMMLRPDLTDAVRSQAALRLRQLGQDEGALLISGGHFVSMQTPVSRRGWNRRLWRIHLAALMDTAERGAPVNDYVNFAFDLWKRMTPREREEAAVPDIYGWNWRIRVLWLWQQGADDRAAEIIQRLQIPERKMRRLQTRLTGCSQDA